MQITIASNRHQVRTPRCTGMDVPDQVHYGGGEPPDFTEEAACLKHLKTAGGFMEMKGGIYEQGYGDALIIPACLQWRKHAWMTRQQGTA